MLPCTFRQLEIFLAAAEDCHFARTADRLGLSQPAVTNHIAALEGQLGKRLFVRRPGTTPVLSTDGLAFLSQARSFVAEGQKIRAFRTEERAPPTTSVRIAAGQHIVDDYIRPSLPELYRAHRGLAVECQTVESVAQGFRLLERGVVELLFFTTVQPCPPRLREELIRPVHFRLYASPAFEAYRHAGPAALSDLPFILPTEGSEQDRMVQAALAEIGVVCTSIALRAPFSDVILKLALDGGGLAALFETMVGAHVERGELIALDLELPSRRRVVFRRPEPVSRPVGAVKDFLASILAS